MVMYIIGKFVPDAFILLYNEISHLIVISCWFVYSSVNKNILSIHLNEMNVWMIGIEN